MKDKTLYVNEIFGPTIQGEGDNVGKICFFIRLSGCDQNPPCKWCDTLTAYKKESGTLMTFEEISNKIIDNCKELRVKKPYRIIVTGGNPCMQSNYGDLARYLKTIFKRVNMCLETQGTILDIESLRAYHHVVISPKGPSSSHDGIRYQNYDNVLEFIKNDYVPRGKNHRLPFKLEIKTVVFTELDLKWALYLLTAINSIGVMNVMYTIQLGTNMNRTTRCLTADDVLKAVCYFKSSIKAPQQCRIRILPQVHRLMDVR